MIVDLHLHSKYSRATSRDMDLEGMYHWGKIKGINVIGTADFTHPEWFSELRDKLQPAEPGLFKLKDEISQKLDSLIPESCRDNSIRFILSVEISNIYSKNDRVRKLHNLVIVPSFEVASYINSELNKIGNLKADGRPILGMDSKELLKITLASDPGSLFIPAHIWTPWFAMFGSKSGFDSITEAFEELTPEIKAVETGLSSDPFMNWRLLELTGITLVSNSDAHSPRNLGREANVINSKLDYFDIIEAIKTGDERFVGTIEFFPQEGKYHYDGHKSCRVSFSPEETLKHQGICPKCNKRLTVGVDYRVNELADKPFGYRPDKHKLVEYIVPLAEIISEVVGVKTKTSPKVSQVYDQLINAFGDEFSILRTIKVNKIKNKYPQVALAIKKMRKRDVFIEPGYDGVFGVVKIFKPGELEQGKQLSLEI
ncbi:endonuclease Q family protein [Patescibacteria group bacterium]|nr:endonuclease Q family protein [Patescibacteria group bacterium]MBU1966739.1 endonuclease Q family protein [Patescibacteria group bacterium]MBU2543214.1 endonuclease Q family protein [Patescibacteria group bacterium]